MRLRFDQQLEQLNIELISMGALCEDAIGAAMKGLLESNNALTERVFRIDEEIDRKEKEIEAICMRLLLQQQPVARDLRLISAALKMVSDMERIGDQAADIAEITKFIDDPEAIGGIHIADMASAATSMVTDAINSYVNKDLVLARAVLQADDVVDDLFIKVKKELVALIATNPAAGEDCIDLFMIAKYLERIGDHATNIAEWVEFSITGEYKGNKL